MSAAPLRPEAVHAVMAPFGESRTLPAAAYTSADVFDWELRHFFEEGWVCVGRAAELETGERRAVRVGAESILLARDADALRAFYNVCRHRGHELLPVGDRAGGPVIKCPYHSWVYGLDGGLRAAPHFGESDGFERADHSLVPVRVEEWRGWIFVNASGDAGSFEQHIGGLDDLVAPYEPERLVSGARHDYVVRANWKIVIENYHECYHCSTIHPELCRVTLRTAGAPSKPPAIGSAATWN